MTTLRSLRSVIREIPPLRAIAKAGFPLLRWANHYRTVTKSIDGIVYSLNLNELIDSTIYYFGTFEPDTSKAIEFLVSKENIVLDIGANVGCHTLLLSQIVGPRGKVIAFEPMKYSYEKLIHNIGLNHWANNIKVEKIALGSFCGTVTSGFRSSWPLFGKHKPVRPEEIQCSTLDSYLEHNHIQTVHFIKIDVDGYEYKVVTGAEKVLRTQKPRLLIELCSYTLDSVGDSLGDLAEALFSYGYTIQADNATVPFSSVQSVLDAVPSDSSINVICT